MYDIHTSYLKRAEIFEPDRVSERLKRVESMTLLDLVYIFEI